MKKIYVIFIWAAVMFSGCDSLRFAPGEGQKQNAWLHNRTAAVAAETARVENCSEKLQGLTKLNELQSRSFSSYFGLPQEFPPAETAEQILDGSSFQLARTAFAESNERPDVWETADAVFDLAIGLCALLGGVYGTRAVRFLREARSKSQALEEIIAGNELFKKTHQEQAAAFKQAHKDQSPQTRQIVAEIKS